MISFWEREHLLKFDTAIVGGGLLGLWTASHLKDSNPNASIVILERGILSMGASTKNAGFTCFGTVTEVLDDIKLMGKEATLNQILARKRGIENINKLFGKSIDYEQIGGMELIFGEDEHVLKEIPALNKWLAPHFNGENVFEIRQDLLKQYGFGKKAKYLIHNKFEGALNTGKYISLLVDKVQKQGIKIISGAEVVGQKKCTVSNNIVVEIKNNNQEYTGKQNFTLECKNLAIATNSLISNLTPTNSSFNNFTPGRGQILITKPIKNGLKFKGTFNFDYGYYYFRTVGNDRVLFGGGRNIDTDNENTSHISNSDIIMNDLKQKLKEFILPGVDYEIDMQWAGIMGFWKDSHKKEYIFEEVTPNVFAGISCCGMGVAQTFASGQKLASVITQKLVSSRIANQSKL